MLNALNTRVIEYTLSVDGVGGIVVVVDIF